MLNLNYSNHSNYSNIWLNSILYSTFNYSYSNRKPYFEHFWKFYQDKLLFMNFFMILESCIQWERFVTSFALKWLPTITSSVIHLVKFQTTLMIERLFTNVTLKFLVFDITVNRSNMFLQVMFLSKRFQTYFAMKR